LILVVDWQIGQNDFPAGLLVTREKDVQPEALLEVSNQLGKMNVRVLQFYRKALEEMETIQEHLEEGIRQRQALVEELNKEIDKLERRKNTLAIDTSARIDVSPGAHGHAS
jgi:chromosome segregation ATPase